MVDGSSPQSAVERLVVNGNGDPMSTAVTPIDNTKDITVTVIIDAVESIIEYKDISVVVQDISEVEVTVLDENDTPVGQPVTVSNPEETNNPVVIDLAGKKGVKLVVKFSPDTSEGAEPQAQINVIKACYTPVTATSGSTVSTTVSATTSTTGTATQSTTSTSTTESTQSTSVVTTSTQTTVSSASTTSGTTSVGTTSAPSTESTASTTSGTTSVGTTSAPTTESTASSTSGTTSVGTNVTPTGQSTSSSSSQSSTTVGTGATTVETTTLATTTKGSSTTTKPSIPTQRVSTTTTTPTSATSQSISTVSTTPCAEEDVMLREDLINIVDNIDINMEGTPVFLDTNYALQSTYGDYAELSDNVAILLTFNNDISPISVKITGPDGGDGNVQQYLLTFPDTSITPRTELTGGEVFSVLQIDLLEKVDPMLPYRIHIEVMQCQGQETQTTTSSTATTTVTTAVSTSGTTSSTAGTTSTTGSSTTVETEEPPTYVHTTKGTGKRTTTSAVLSTSTQSTVSTTGTSATVSSTSSTQSSSLTVTTSTVSSPSSTTVGTGATVGETTTLTTSSQGSTTTTAPTIPTRPVTTTTPSPTTSYSTTSEQPSTTSVTETSTGSTGTTTQQSTGTETTEGTTSSSAPTTSVSTTAAPTSTATSVTSGTTTPSVTSSGTTATSVSTESTTVSGTTTEQTGPTEESTTTMQTTTEGSTTTTVTAPPPPTTTTQATTTGTTTGATGSTTTVTETTTSATGTTSVTGSTTAETTSSTTATPPAPSTSVSTSTTGQSTTSTAPSTTSPVTSTSTTLETTTVPECTELMVDGSTNVDKIDTVVVNSEGDGLTEAANPDDPSQPIIITYKITSVETPVEFKTFTASVTDVSTIKITVKGTDGENVAPPKTVDVVNDGVTSIPLNGISGESVVVEITSKPDKSSEINNVEIKACYTPGTTTGATGSTTTVTETTTSATGTTSVTGSTTAETTSSTTVASTSSTSPSSTTVGTGATVGETTTLTTSSQGPTTTTAPTIPTRPVTTTTPPTTTTTYSTTSGQETTTTSSTATTTVTTAVSTSGTTSSTAETTSATVTTSTASSLSSTTVGTGATVGETTTLTTSSPGSTTTTRPSIPTPPVSTSTSTETTSVGSTTTTPVSTSTISTYPSETMTLTNEVTTASASTTTSPSATTGTTSTSAPTTTPCEHKTMEMRENLQNIRVTVVGKSNQYSGTAVTSTLTLDDNSETIIAEIINVEEDDSPIFTVAFTVSNVGEMNIQLESSTGANVEIKPTQYLLGGVNEAVSVEFNGAAGNKLVIQLKKASNEVMPMDISKLSIESCFESTACELTTVEQQDASTFSTVKDIDGNIVEEVFSSSSTLDNLSLNENGELVFFVLFNEATLLTMPITISSVKLQLYYSGFKLYEITSPSNQNMDIHFDLMIENIDSLQFIITPIGDNPVFRINGFVGCVKPIGSTTTSTTTTSTITQTGSTPTGTTTPTVSTGTTTPTISTPCDKTLIASGLNEQNVIITVASDPSVYGNKALLGTLPISSTSTRIVVKLVETVENDNEIFELTFNTKRIASVDATLETEAGTTSAGPLTSIPSGANGEVTFNFNGAEGHTIEIILTPSSYDQTIEISELKIEACFESTACEIVPTVNSDNYQNYVLVTDETAAAVDTLFISGDLSDVQRNFDGNIPVILNFNKATIYDITFSTQEPTTVRIVIGISSFDFPVDGVMTIHLSGLMKDLNTITFIVQATAVQANPVFKIESITGCMGPMGTTTTASTSTATTGTTTVETTTHKETTTSGPTFTSPTSESTTEFSVSSTVPSVTSPTTTVSVTPTLSSPTTSITFTQPTTTTATIATTTTMPSTTVGQCIVSGEYLDAMTGYNSYVDDVDKPLGYYLQNGQQVPVFIDDTIEQGDIVHFYCQNCTCSAVGQWECNERIEPCSCSYFTWSDWTNCDADCGSGVRERTRELIPGLYDSCKETDTDKESCFVGPCITTTERPWTTWSPCNADDCETGSQTRTRCESNDVSCVETRTCANNNTNCICGEGREFKSVCDYTCNSTCKAYRNADCQDRECDTKTCLCADGTTEYNGQCIKFENCPCFDDDGKPMIINTTKTYDDCKICTCTAQGMDCRLKDGCCIHEPWSEWNTCHNNNDCGKGTRTRYSAVRVGNCEPEEESEECDLEPCGQCVYEGKYYNNTDVVEEDSDKCTKKICINGSITDTTVEGQDGGFSDWTTWGACSATQMQCNGTRERRRECNNPLPQCGEPCVGDFTDTEQCSSVICCAVTLWSPWTECSEECGGGITTRTREQLVPGDAAYCSNSLTETETCNTQSCETNCTVGEWSDWTPCSVTCGPGSRSRQRDITSDVTEECPHLNETDDCYPQDCLCTEMNEVWSNYSGCEKTCEDTYSNQPCSGPPACVCEIGSVRNADGVCIKVHECNQCKLPDNTTILEGDDFINPLDQCERCKCEDGKIVCNPKCTEEPQCLEGERKVKTDDGCCYTCKKDTCDIRHESKVLSNITYEGFTNCKTNKPVTYNYCSGGCGDSSHFPSGLGLPSQCKCCTSIDTERIEIEITCPDPEYPNQSQLKTLTYNQPTSCKCNVSPCIPPA